MNVTKILKNVKDVLKINSYVSLVSRKKLVELIKDRT